MNPSRVSFSTRQPGKALYTLAFISSVLPKLAFYLIIYLPRYFRPHTKWTYRQALMNKAVRYFLHWQSVVRIKTPQDLKPGVEKERFLMIEPREAKFYQGIANNSEIKPITFGAVWYPSPPTASDIAEKTFIIHFHGGAFVIGAARDEDIAFGGRLLASRTSSKVLMAHYRLSSNPGGQFPAALQDAVTAYRYLLDQGISSSRIAVSGDSAGGNLTLAILRYISEVSDERLLPSPAGALLWSPWLDLHSAKDPQYITNNRQWGTDYLAPPFIKWGIETFIPPSMKSDDPYISPMRHPFASKVPMWIQAGGVEMLYDEIVKFTENMRKVKGNVVELHIEPYANHDIIYVGALTGFEMETKRCAELANEFLRGNGFGK